MTSSRSVAPGPNAFRPSILQWLLLGAILASLAAVAVVVTKTAIATRVEIEQRINGLRAEEEQLKSRIKTANDELLVKREQLAQVNAELDAYAKRETTRPTAAPQIDTPAATDVATLVALFSGPDRRIASDKLIALYAAGKKTEVVSALLGAVAPKEAANSYRVNLYILFTFARIRPTWEGSPAQVSGVQALAALASYYNDRTYSEWARKAVSQARAK